MKPDWETHINELGAKVIRMKPLSDDHLNSVPSQDVGDELAEEYSIAAAGYIKNQAGQYYMPYGPIGMTDYGLLFPKGVVYVDDFGNFQPIPLIIDKEGYWVMVTDEQGHVVANPTTRKNLWREQRTLWQSQPFTEIPTKDDHIVEVMRKDGFIYSDRGKLYKVRGDRPLVRDLHGNYFPDGVVIRNKRGEWQPAEMRKDSEGKTYWVIPNLNDEWVLPQDTEEIPVEELEQADLNRNSPAQKVKDLLASFGWIQNPHTGMWYRTWGDVEADRFGNWAPKGPVYKDAFGNLQPLPRLADGSYVFPKDFTPGQPRPTPAEFVQVWRIW